MKRPKNFWCVWFGHKRRVLASMPAVFASEPDLFTICKCSRCGETWLEPAEALS